MPGTHHYEPLQSARQQASISADVRKPSEKAVGLPRAKQRLSKLDTLAACLSLTCAALGVAVVANELLSWKLGVIDQLIVVGFLLSIMNLCLGRVVPAVLLLLEARFGKSTLQNYDAILRNQFLARQADFVWRLVIAILLALPLGLSAGYKTFTGGESSQMVDAHDYIGMKPYYGLYALPGLQPLGQDIGLTIFFNATMPFLSASIVPDNPGNGSWYRYGNPTYPPLPHFPHSYGYNILVLDEHRTAILDIPHSDYISAMQASLASDESWDIKANVLATVASRNDSINAHRQNANDSFWDTYAPSSNTEIDNGGGASAITLFSGYSVQLLETSKTSSWVILGVFKAGYISSSFSHNWDSQPSFLKHAQMYNIERKQCEGRWTLTRGNMQLKEGKCYDTELPKSQQIYEISYLALGNWYMGALGEILGQFADGNHPSHWKDTVMTAITAAMLWSRKTGLAGFDSRGYLYPEGSTYNETVAEMGYNYSVRQDVQLNRPTLQKSPWLYALFGIQPVLTIGILVLGTFLFSTPIDRGFGMVSIMAGVDPADLALLRGAALSGELDTKVGLNVGVEGRGAGNGEVLYQLGKRDYPQHGKVKHGVIYS